MKLIIEIEKDYYEMLKYNVEHGQEYKPFEIIASGIPYNPTGDLISREALKEALKSGCEICPDANTNWCEHCCKINDFEDLIDNAPTVLFPLTVKINDNVTDEDKEVLKRLMKDYKPQVLNFEAEEIDNAPTVCGNNPKWCESCVSKGKCASTRPQGEWIGIKTSCDIGHKFYFCSICSREIDLFDSETLEDYPFCHCGADMRKGDNALTVERPQGDLIKAFELLKAHCKNRECNKDCVFFRELRTGNNIEQFCGLCEIVTSDDSENADKTP